MQCFEILREVFLRTELLQAVLEILWYEDRCYLGVGRQAVVCLHRPMSSLMLSCFWDVLLQCCYKAFEKQFLIVKNIFLSLCSLRIDFCFLCRSVHRPQKLISWEQNSNEEMFTFCSYTIRAGFINTELIISTSAKALYVNVQKRSEPAHGLSCSIKILWKIKCTVQKINTVILYHQTVNYCFHKIIIIPAYWYWMGIRSIVKNKVIFNFFMSSSINTHVKNLGICHSVKIIWINDNFAAMFFVIPAIPLLLCASLIFKDPYWPPHGGWKCSRDVCLEREEDGKEKSQRTGANSADVFNGSFQP